ncbi:MAG: aldehyde ferredoxin oxidoreductase family protein [Gammaproteobacteria bacterium]|nr:aldehyde ferredoxin oxidoreductase family protein [Gammaproteobacteria bacterium]MBT3724511.1 aldehyde ferredoxin oxidoreductase family protein [Gammaproteobacteria bacterium]MBT4076494.1 aldehyde ferredoxin oxidoreductase family protein [Gammaproteobacteria bacterium]MBT4194462.1 aldehyde ferredoxin oxidoreductase family protein [Gammaproteobacteria bacterium]MBT4451144.1 aldehyde ferredoxin oxidoreductase family protein [Gammaproteobacteria bacterium]
MSWQRLILRVNLTTQKCHIESLNMDWAQQYLGQRGLGSKYLFEEMDPAAGALSAENKLIFATGPLTGTMASTGGRYSVITKGALTGAIACSNSGGKFGAELKLAGFDLLIIEGQSTRPVYLSIENEIVELRDASHVWGKTVWDTEILLSADDSLLKIASIGPAGENLCRFACVVNDRHRAAGRSGVGAVMGAKKLKAIAVRGTRGMLCDDNSHACKEIFQSINNRLTNQQGYRRNGTLAMMDITNSFGSLPTRNNQQVQFEQAAKINAEAMQTPNRNGHTNLVTNAACFACTIGCGRICKIDPAHFSIKDKPQYHGASGGLEYETAYALGAACGVADIDASTYAGFLCNEYGMDPISLGGTIAAAMEMFETGILSDTDTGGIKLEFGSAEALCEITELTAKGEGFGQQIAMGSKLLTKKYDCPELSMSVKGQEFAAYDGRSMQGMGLAYATSNRGACHLRAAPYGHDFKSTDIQGKAEVVKISQDEVAFIDSTGLCLFTGGSGWSLSDYCELINTVCEGVWNEQRVIETGERIWNLERQFNLQAGLGKKHDTLPRRILEEPAKSGVGKGLVNKLGEMLPEYYRLRGWEEDGRPSEETLKRLGLKYANQY